MRRLSDHQMVSANQSTHCVFLGRGQEHYTHVKAIYGSSWDSSCNSSFVTCKFVSYRVVLCRTDPSFHNVHCFLLLLQNIAASIYSCFIVEMPGYNKLVELNSTWRCLLRVLLLFLRWLSFSRSLSFHQQDSQLLYRFVLTFRDSGLRHMKR